jgi:hypothetical protein
MTRSVGTPAGPRPARSGREVRSPRHGTRGRAVPAGRPVGGCVIWREPFRLHATGSVSKISAFVLGILVFIWLEDLTPVDPVSLAGDLLLLALLVAALLIPPRACIGDLGISRGSSLIRWNRYISHTATRLAGDLYIIRIRYRIWKFAGSMRLAGPRRAIIELERRVRRMP